MPDDKKSLSGLMEGVRHSSRFDSKKSNEPKVTKVKQPTSSLTKLLGNKKSRKSFSFEEDEGFVFKRADSSSRSSQVAKKGPPTPKGITTEKKKNTKAKPKALPKKLLKLESQQSKKPSRQSFLAQIETPSEDEELQQQQQPTRNTIDVPKKRGRRPKQEFSFGVEGPKTKKLKLTTKHKVQPPVSPPISSPARQVAAYDEQETSIQMLLPISDSPIQRRNKEFRDSSKRRSSLGNRGKRASSIGNGFVAIPHADVPVEDFHKHLDESLPEPHKMRKLLIWCSKRLLAQENLNLKKLKNETAGEELTAFNIAKVIKEEIIRDLMEGRLNTSWYSRVESNEVKEEKSIKLLPNIQNLTNESNIKLLRKRLQDLKDEKLRWFKAYETIPKFTKSEPTADLKLTKELPLVEEIHNFNNKYLQFNNNSLKSQSLEPKIDQLHKLVNNLTTNDEVLTMFQKKIKGRINGMVNDYATSLTEKAVVDNDDLLKGISRIEGDFEEEKE